MRRSSLRRRQLDNFVVPNESEAPESIVDVLTAPAGLGAGAGMSGLGLRRRRRSRRYRPWPMEVESNLPRMPKISSSKCEIMWSVGNSPRKRATPGIDVALEGHWGAWPWCTRAGRFRMWMSARCEAVVHMPRPAPRRAQRWALSIVGDASSWSSPTMQWVQIISNLLTTMEARHPSPHFKRSRLATLLAMHSGIAHPGSAFSTHLS